MVCQLLCLILLFVFKIYHSESWKKSCGVGLSVLLT